jgi:hypothetical protein
MNSVRGFCVNDRFLDFRCPLLGGLFDGATPKHQSLTLTGVSEMFAARARKIVCANYVKLFHWFFYYC